MLSQQGAYVMRPDQPVLEDLKSSDVLSNFAEMMD